MTSSRPAKRFWSNLGVRAASAIVLAGVTIAGGWVARQKSRHTRRAYVRTFKAWEEYARSTGIHPLQAKLPLADAYATHLPKTPTTTRRGPM